MKTMIVCFIQSVIFLALKMKSNINPDLILTPDQVCDRVTVYTLASKSNWSTLQSLFEEVALTPPSGTTKNIWNPGSWPKQYMKIWNKSSNLFISLFWIYCGGQKAQVLFCVHELKINFIHLFVIFFYQNKCLFS